MIWFLLQPPKERADNPLMALQSLERARHLIETAKTFTAPASEESRSFHDLLWNLEVLEANLNDHLRNKCQRLVGESDE